MSERKKVPGESGDPAKAERLAAALRANLKRRKSQARAQTQPDPGARGEADPPETLRKTGQD